MDNLWISVTVPLGGMGGLVGWVSRAGGGHGRAGGLSNLAGEWAGGRLNRLLLAGEWAGGLLRPYYYQRDSASQASHHASSA